MSVVLSSALPPVRTRLGTELLGLTQASLPRPPSRGFQLPDFKGVVASSPPPHPHPHPPANTPDQPPPPSPPTPLPAPIVHQLRPPFHFLFYRTTPTECLWPCQSLPQEKKTTKQNLRKARRKQNARKERNKVCLHSDAEAVASALAYVACTLSCSMRQLTCLTIIPCDSAHCKGARARAGRVPCLTNKRRG